MQIMKYIKTLILILLTSNIYSQSYEDIKKLDTIYIPFKKGKFDIKHVNTVEFVYTGHRGTGKF